MLDFSNVSSLGIPVHMFAQLGFYVVLGLYCIFTGVFYYHWQTYSSDIRVTGMTFILYFITTIPLLVCMGIMTLII